MEITLTVHDFNAATPKGQHCTEMLSQKRSVTSAGLTDQDKCFVELHYFIQFGFGLKPRVGTKLFSVL